MTVYKKIRPSGNSRRQNQHEIILILTSIWASVKPKILGFATFLSLAGMYAAFAACESGMTTPFTCLWTSLLCIAGFVLFGELAGIFLTKGDFK